MSKQRVVIVGGGFGGLNAAVHLAKSNFDVVVVDKTNHHLFQPLLYQVASAALAASDIAYNLREVLYRYSNTSVIMAEVQSVDTSAKAIKFLDGETLSYDYLILAVGTRQSYFGHPEWETHAPGLKSIKDATSIRDQILLAFEMAERSDDLEERKKLLSFVIVGGGPTGVEMAGAIAEIARKSMFKNFRRIHPENSKIYLIEGQPEIMSAFPSHLRAVAKRDLEQMGVIVYNDAFVTDITTQGVHIGDMFIPTVNVIWAAGNEAPALLKTLKTPLDKQGRVIVQQDLSIPNHPEVFVIGDAAAAKDKEGKPIPGVAPAAIQEGKYVAEIIKEGKGADQRVPFAYFDKGMMATIGKAKAIVAFGKMQLSGFFAWLCWGLIHIMYLIGFRNRLLVMMQWFFCYCTGKRNVRLIDKSIDSYITELRQDKKDMK